MIPTAFVERLESELGVERARQVIESFAKDKQTAFWINPLVAGEIPALGEIVPGLVDVRVVGPTLREALVTHPAAERGRIYPINPSSVMAVEALAPQPGEEVLDLAAAPGGKTILIAARMANEGRIGAVEPIRARFFRLRANLERCGVSIAQCYQDDGRRVGRKTPERFDRVLLDAPCASEARFRRDDPTTFAHWTPRKTKEMVRKQRGLIASAFTALKPRGVLVYCTCSFSLRENEGVVEWLLNREPGAALVTPELPIDAASGGLPSTVRLWPDDIYDGFFIAKLTKR